MNEPIKIQVRFSDLDTMGHVNNAVYLSYFEMARIEYFTPLMGMDWDWKQFGILLRKNEIEYFKPVLLNDQPKISLFVLHIGTKSFTLGYELKVRDEIYTTGSSVLVTFDGINNISIEIPEKMRNVLTSLIKE